MFLQRIKYDLIFTQFKFSKKKFSHWSSKTDWSRSDDQESSGIFECRRQSRSLIMKVEKSCIGTETVERTQTSFWRSWVDDQLNVTRSDLTRRSVEATNCLNAALKLSNKIRSLLPQSASPNSVTQKEQIRPASTYIYLEKEVKTLMIFFPFNAKAANV